MSRSRSINAGGHSVRRARLSITTAYDSRPAMDTGMPSVVNDEESAMSGAEAWKQVAQLSQRPVSPPRLDNGTGRLADLDERALVDAQGRDGFLQDLPATASSRSSGASAVTRDERLVAMRSD